MPEVLRSSVPHADHEVGPNYFACYIREIEELFAQKEDSISSLSSKSDISFARTCTDVKDNDIVDNHCRSEEVVRFSRKLYANGIDDSLSDLRKERLRGSLKQSVTELSQEVDQTLDSVLSMRKIKNHLKEQVEPPNSPSSDDSDVKQSSPKKQKLSSSPSSNSVSKHTSALGSQSCDGLDPELRSLLSHPHAKEIVEKYSDELFEKLGNMEKQLERYLNTIMSNCRKMTSTEKQELRRLIQNLPPKNLDRVVDIIVQHRKLSGGRPCNEIHVDLENEDNVTLWRLYYYVKAVDSAKGGLE